MRARDIYISGNIFIRKVKYQGRKKRTMSTIDIEHININIIILHVYDVQLSMSTPKLLTIDINIILF